MNTVFVSVCCAQAYFDQLMKEIKNPTQSDQKLHSLLLKGLCKTQEGIVSAVSALPVNRRNYPRHYTKATELEQDGCRFYHMANINFPVLSNLWNFLQCFVRVLRLCRSDRKNTVVICDVLKLSICTASMLACRLIGVLCCGIVTDVPQIRPMKGNLLVRVSDYLRRKQLQAYDGYIFLTEQMNPLLNRKGKPYIVVEGTVDASIANRENRAEEKYPKKVCVYSGSLHRVYGVKSLVEGYLQADIQNSELWLYGDGDYRSDLEELCRIHPDIRYFGVVPNSQVVQVQMQATLLINPRPPIGEYTKYSFPSKNMEYMASGTPLLAAMLPGMPKEYQPYIYELKDYSSAGIKNALERILNLKNDELHQKGSEAKEFVLSRKNNIVQGQRIIELIQRCQLKE